MSLASAVVQALLSDVAFKSVCPQVYAGDGGQATKFPYIVIYATDQDAQETLDPKGDREALAAAGQTIFETGGATDSVELHCLHDSQALAWRLGRHARRVLLDYEGETTINGLTIRIDAVHPTGETNDTIRSEDGSQIHSFECLQTFRILFDVRETV